MLFNSLTFFVFLLIFLCGWHWAKNQTSLRLWYIVIGSAVFYGWWDWRFLFLIGYVGLVDFLIALAMERTQEGSIRRKLLLSVSLINAIGSLSIFKYSAFLAHNLETFFSWFGLHPHLYSHIPSFCLILPVGISFFTFQSMSYSIDVYRKDIPATKSYVHYMAYLMLFPQLVAGPIVRAKDLLFNLLMPPVFSNATRYSALKLIIVGFFKKCFLADNIAVYVNQYFASVNTQQNCWGWWIVMILFSIQIYCDFSGYSDIARGIIKFLGYRFPLNFNHPYIAASVREFWERWHISLSSWFRDYVYIPLGGSRHPRFPKLFGLRNLWITFLLSGLWHGAAWNFVIWGGLHAFYLSIDRVTGYSKLWRDRKWLRFGGIILVQLQVLLAWIFFRSASTGDAMHILKKMFSFSMAPEKILDGSMWFYLAVFVVMEAFLIRNADRFIWRRFPRGRRFLEPLFLAVLAAATIFFRGAGNEFIYFQF